MFIYIFPFSRKRFKNEEGWCIFPFSCTRSFPRKRFKNEHIHAFLPAFFVTFPVRRVDYKGKRIDQFERFKSNRVESSTFSALPHNPQANRLPVRQVDCKGKRIDRFESNRVESSTFSALLHSPQPASESTSGKTSRLQRQTNRSIRVESSQIVNIFCPPS